MSSLYFNYVTDSPCPYHRLLCPARFCAPDFPGVPIDCAAGLIPKGYTAYGVTGLLNQEWYWEIGQWLRDGCKFVWGVDDDWHSVPEWNRSKPTADQLGSWWVSARLADRIIVSTAHLASTFPKEYRDKVVVAPNLLDLDQYPNLGHPPVDKTVRVLWSGSSTHLRDTEAVAGAVDVLLAKWGDRKAQFIFFGQPPPQRLLKKYAHKGVAWQPAVPFLQYWQVVNSFRPHIVLAPLDDCEFNRSKSALRVMEGWALSAAVVASPVGEYGNKVVHGDTGLYARTEKEWVDCLDRLVHDADLRRTLAVNGRREVERTGNWARWECRRPWHRAFTDILGVDAVRPVEGEAA